MNQLPSEIVKNIFSFNNENFLFSGTISKNIYNSIDSRVTSHGSVLESASRVNESIDGNLDLSSRLLENLAKLDKPEFIHVCIQNGLEWDHFCVETAAQYNSVSFIEFVNSSELFWLPENAFISAIEVKNIDLCKKMHGLGMGFHDERCKIHAQKNEYHDIVKWLNDIEDTDEYKIYSIIKRDCVSELVDMNLDVSYDFERFIITTCCVNGSSECLKFFINYGMSPSHKDLIYSDHMDRENISYILMNIDEFSMEY